MKKLLPGLSIALVFGMGTLPPLGPDVLWCGERGFPSGGIQEPSPDTPRKYRGLYARLEEQVAAFEGRINASWDGRAHPVAFSAELLAANSHRGEALLDPEKYAGVLLHLERLKALGVKAVTVKISFPILYLPFHKDLSEYRQYLSFYKRLAQDIRSRGLKLIIGSQAIFSKGHYTDLDVARFYRGLTFQQYKEGRRQVILTIARHLKPDYMAVVLEPDTEAIQTGKPVNNVANCTEMVDYFLEGLKVTGLEEGISVGAGVGTWHPRYRDFIDSFAALRDLDFIDMHIYPVNFDFLDRALTIADMARASGKAVAMTEAWLYKARDRELATVTNVAIFSRDVFNFWGPLDAQFLAALVKLGHYRKFEFISPFWTNLFFSYLDYDKTHHLRPRKLMALSTRAAAVNMVFNRYTRTGATYGQLIGEPASTRVSEIAPAGQGGRLDGSPVWNRIASDRFM